MELISDSLFYLLIIGFILMIITYLVEGIESTFILYLRQRKDKKEKQDKNSR